jgi:hypothetical protein
MASMVLRMSPSSPHSDSRLIKHPHQQPALATVTSQTSYSVGLAWLGLARLPRNEGRSKVPDL